MKFLEDIIVLDTETSNYDIEEAEIIELACGKLVDSKWVTEVEQFKPQNEVTAQAMSTSWITNEDLEDKPQYNEGVLLEKYLSTDPYIVCHNTPYDKTVLQMNAERYSTKNYGVFQDDTKWICTLKLARKLYRDNNFPEFKLSFLWFQLGLYKDSDREIQAHRADSDIYMTAKLLEHIIEKLLQEGSITEENLLQDLYNYQEEPVLLNVFPFGKYKGYKPEDIPDDYYVWLLEKSDALKEDSRNYNKDLAYTVQEVLSARLD